MADVGEGDAAVTAPEKPTEDHVTHHPAHHEKPEEKAEEKVEEKVEEKAEKMEIEGEEERGKKRARSPSPSRGKEQEKEEEGREAKIQKTEEGPVPAMSEPRAEGENESESSVLERGHVYFFYRPKVGQKEQHTWDDVARTYMLLVPDNTASHSRLLIIPKKSLPNVTKKSDRVWAFVDLAGPMDTLVHELSEKEYETKTRGHRVSPGAKLVARGVYVFANHKEPKSKHTFQNHVHFAYDITHPNEPHALQKHFNLFDEGDLIFQVKNPLDKASSFLPKTHQKLPHELQHLYGEHKFIPVNPPRLLDYKGQEVLIIAAHHYPTELEDIGEKLEQTAEHEKHKISLNNIKTELQLAKNDPEMSLHPLQGKYE